MLYGLIYQHLYQIPKLFVWIYKRKSTSGSWRVSLTIFRKTSKWVLRRHFFLCWPTCHSSIQPPWDLFLYSGTLFSHWPSNPFLLRLNLILKHISSHLLTTCLWPSRSSEDCAHIVYVLMDQHSVMRAVLKAKRCLLNMLVIQPGA